jgi:hypothetical protein
MPSVRTSFDIMWYFESISSCLIEYYNQTPDQADKIMSGWFDKSKGFLLDEESVALMLHYEPLHVAADLLHIEDHIDYKTDENKYDKLIQQAALTAVESLLDLRPGIVREWVTHTSPDSKVG